MVHIIYSYKLKGAVLGEDLNKLSFCSDPNFNLHVKLCMFYNIFDDE